MGKLKVFSMWPFKRKNLPWISIAKTVKKTIYVLNSEPIVTYTTEYYSKLPEWENPHDYHFESRAAMWDTDWEGKSDYVTISTNPGVTSIRKSQIIKITYEVVNEND